MASGSRPQQSESPRAIITAAISTSSVPQLQHGLDLFGKSRRGLTEHDLQWALNLAVRECKPEVVTFLLDRTAAKVEMVRAESVGAASRDARFAVEGKEGGKLREVLEMLVGRGWDVNNYTQGSQPLLYHLTHSQPLISWALNHGAVVSANQAPSADTEPDSSATDASLPALTEEIALHGTVTALQAVLQASAPLGRRTLHRAVQGAAFAKEDVGAERMGVVRYLVEVAGCDVNGLDVEEGQQRPNHWGCPMVYAIPAGQGEHGDGGEGVVRYLLQKGANPHIKDCWGMYDVFGLAERMKNERVLAVLMEWEEKGAGKGEQKEP